MLYAVKTKRLQKAEQRNFICPAKISHVDEGNIFKVEMVVYGRPCKAWAYPAMAGDCVLKEGDRVLVAGESPDECYIIGMIDPKNPLHRQDKNLTTCQGASAQIIERGGNECIQVKDANCRVLFEYQPETGRGILSMPAGDLCLQAPLGNIDLISGKNIRCLSAAETDIQSGKGVRISTSRKNGEEPSWISLDKRKLELSGPKLKISAQKGDFLINKGTYTGVQFSATVERAKFVLQRLETVAERILQRAKNIYRHVEDLSQIRAGRIRTMVKGPFSLLGKSASINAEEDVKIDGNRIHLG